MCITLCSAHLNKVSVIFYNANTPAFNANEAHYRMQHIHRRQRYLPGAINVVLLVESRVENRLNFINICRNSLSAASIHQGSNNPSNNDQMKVKNIMNLDLELLAELHFCFLKTDLGGWIAGVA